MKKGEEQEYEGINIQMRTVPNMYLHVSVIS